MRLMETKLIAWEYRAVKIHGYTVAKGEEELNALGAEGWELVAIVGVQDGNFFTAFMKRARA